MLKLLDPTAPDDATYLDQLHQLRYEIFYVGLHWRDGLVVRNEREYDQFDHPDARYLVRINPETDKVDAGTRLITTDKPYLLGDVFSRFVVDGEAPSSLSTMETSRLCANSKTAPSNIVGELMAGMLELGLKSGIDTLVSLSDIRIRPAVRRGGWVFKELGPHMPTSTDISVALEYPITQDWLENVRRVSRLGGEVLEPGAMMPLTDIFPGTAPLQEFACRH